MAGIPSWLLVLFLASFSDQVESERFTWLRPEYFEGDLQEITPAAKNPAANPRFGQAWPGGVIPFDIEEDIPFPATVAIMAAINEIHEKTCIKFTPARAEDVDQLVFARRRDGMGCTSAVGRIGGSQKILLSSQCESKGIILHLIFHALGFWHEHTRDDRNDYATALNENIISGAEAYFQQYTSKADHHEGMEYDLESIMHFPSFAFASSANKLTIQSAKRTDDIQAFDLFRGLRQGTTGAAFDDETVLSETDVMKLNSRYCIGWMDSASLEDGEESHLRRQLRQAGVHAAAEDSTIDPPTTKKKKSSEQRADEAARQSRRQEERDEDRRRSRGKKKGKGRSRRSSSNAGVDTQQIFSSCETEEPERRLKIDETISINHREINGTGETDDESENHRPVRSPGKRKSREHASQRGKKAGSTKHSQHGHTHTHHGHHVSAVDRRGKESTGILKAT